MLCFLFQIFIRCLSSVSRQEADSQLLTFDWIIPQHDVAVNCYSSILPALCCLAPERRLSSSLISLLSYTYWHSSATSDGFGLLLIYGSVFPTGCLIPEGRPVEDALLNLRPYSNIYERVVFSDWKHIPATIACYEVHSRGNAVFPPISSAPSKNASYFKAWEIYEKEQGKYFRVSLPHFLD